MSLPSTMTADSEKNTLLVNIGSASRKYALYANGAVVFTAHFEHLCGNYVVQTQQNGSGATESISAEQYADALAYTVRELVAHKLISDTHDIVRVGFRVVAPGSFFTEHRLIDSDYMARLEVLQSEEPLHIKPMRDELLRLQTTLAGVPVFGLSDSAFHAHMPDYARRYAIGSDISEQLDIARFGYHGLSYASVLDSLRARGDLPQRIVICHLGSGASIAAIRNGVCIDTSMGFSPLEGLVMATRVGDIDAGALVRIARAKNSDLAALEKYLYTESGLLGLSGTTGDMKELLRLEATGDARARGAIEVFVYRIQKYIGAYAAVLNGIDLLVFTGTIGERSHDLRSRICANLGYLDLRISDEKNTTDISETGIADINASGGSILVMKSDELSAMARALSALLQ